MKKPGFFLLFFLVSGFVSAQQKVTFILKKLPSYHKPTDTVFLAGSFNNWNPKHQSFSLRGVPGQHGITIDLPKGITEYKFTLGSWEAVESGKEGFPTSNRVMTIDGDTTVVVEIEHWASNFAKKERKSTASKNVKVLSEAFFIPQLNRNRRIWIYLPESYSKTKKKYPVLYMHDGQNVFDNATSGFGEWGVDEALDSLGKKLGEIIVVAIDHGGEKRINEYAPFDMEKHGKGEGGRYVDFLVKTLKPHIDQHYRTKRSAKYTAIAGSSMGGLISFYAMLQYPNKFGTAGVFSPAFWIVPQLKDYIATRAGKVKGRLYFYAGQQESKTMVPDMLEAFELMKQKSKAVMHTHVRAEGKHNEPTWREEFPLFYSWWMERHD